MKELQADVQPGQVREATAALLAYCRKNLWAGTDPYDALNSRLFNSTPLQQSRICRIAFTQLLKRLPVDLRPLLGIGKEQNPKAIALFLMSSLRLSRTGFSDGEEVTAAMLERLVALRSPGTRYWCWGYSFPWQTRTTLVPKGAPNLVCTVFVADALLDAYQSAGCDRCLQMAVSAGEYILEELYWSDGASLAGFSYPLPGLPTRVHNANLLAAALFCRLARLTGEKKFLAPALSAARYSAGCQRPDGSWDYGEGEAQGWADNFHTGYNLCALHSIGHSLADQEFDPHLQRGFAFYRNHFFREDGAPRYFHDRTYPIDIHCVAQSIISLLTLQELDPGNAPLALDVFDFAMKRMWNREGYFYYRIAPLCTNRISYMRWSQAWMLLALSQLLTVLDTAGKLPPARPKRR